MDKDASLHPTACHPGHQGTSCGLDVSDSARGKWLGSVLCWGLRNHRAYFWRDLGVPKPRIWGRSS